jgi:hypothetical protein
VELTPHILNCTALNVVITDERLIGKPLEGSSEGLIEVITLHFSAGQSQNMTHLGQDSQYPDQPSHLS